MIYSFPYDTTYPGPAMPVVEIQINQIGKETDPITIQALVDSGADGSIIPFEYLRQMAYARTVGNRWGADEAGWEIMRLAMDSDVLAKMLVFGLVGFVEVVDPVELREAVLAQARALIEHLVL